MDTLNALFRWLHIFAGVIWIGMLYFFNWVNGPFQGTLDGETKKKIVPELMPRALWWFRWGAAWTWLTGVLLLMLVFYHGGIMFDGDGKWTAAAGVMVALTFLAPLAYDALQLTGLGKDPKVFGAVCYLLVVLFVVGAALWAGFSYRATNIHLGALFGTTMAMNVWRRIWPSQQQIITAVKAGTPPDAAVVALAGVRSRHNVYMSVPLVWAMINQHTTTVPLQVGLPAAYAWALPLLVILVGWHIVWQLYKRAPKVKGF